MSAFGNEERTSKTYASINAGKITVRAKDQNAIGPNGAKPKSREITDKQTGEKRTIHEFIYDFLKGNLTSVKILKHEKFGWQYIIELSNVGDDIELTIPADSKYGDSFVTKLPNLKLGAYYSIKPYNFEDKEKRNKKGEPVKQIGVTILIDGDKDKKVQPAFTKENQGNKPLPTSDNMDEDDYKAYMITLRKFYRSLVDQFNAANVSAPKPEQNNTPAPAPSGNGQEDDLPF